MSGLSRFSTVVFQVTAGHRYGGRGFLRCCADLAGARGRRVCTVLWLWVMSVLGGCGIARSEQEVPPVYTADVEDLLLRRCGACHGAEPGASAAAGYRVGSYGQVLACSTLSPDQSVVLPYTADAPILKVFEWSAEHVGLLEQAEAERLQAWVLAGAPLTAGGVHGSDILRPDGPGFHGALAAHDQYGPLADSAHPWVCGRCHQDAPVTPAGVYSPAPGATACSVCHGLTQALAPLGEELPVAEAPILGCLTCHQVGMQGLSPLAEVATACTSEVPADGHRAHDETEGLGVDCARCHPLPTQGALGLTHGNGQVEVRIVHPDGSAAGAFERATGTCTTYCHQNEGSGEAMSWHESGAGPGQCVGCHGSPPANHYEGACSSCHEEANNVGTALSMGPLHLNGVVDLGDGSGSCLACHRSEGTPWPNEAVHDAHRTSTLGASVACDDCHRVPEQVDEAGHLEGSGAEIWLAGGGEFKEGRCVGVPCHGERTVTWAKVGGLGCSECHGAPPEAPHSPERGCSDQLCHGQEVRPLGATWEITAAGRSLHMNGIVNGGAGSGFNEN